MQKKPTTELGRCCIQAVDRHMNTLSGHKQHRTKNSLRDVILGGQDGLVNMLGIALGVVAAGGSNHVLVVTGIAAAITESISMGAVAYTSFGSDRDFYFAERRRSKVRSPRTPMKNGRKSGRSTQRRVSGDSCSMMSLRPLLRTGKRG
jgi:hypothetical protein